MTFIEANPKFQDHSLFDKHRSAQRVAYEPASEARETTTYGKPANRLVSVCADISMSAVSLSWAHNTATTGHVPNTVEVLSRCCSRNPAMKCFADPSAALSPCWCWHQRIVNILQPRKLYSTVWEVSDCAPEKQAHASE